MPLKSDDGEIAFIERIIDLSATDRAYLAGLFDGEGTVGVYPKKLYRDEPNPHFMSTVAITMSDLSVIEWLIQKIGGGFTTREPKVDHHLTVYKWELSKKRHIKAFIRAIYPYSIVKKPQLDLMLEYIRLPREEHERKAEIVLLLKQVKRRQDSAT